MGMILLGIFVLILLGFLMLSKRGREVGLGILEFCICVFDFSG
jgi:hypothetical protein